MPVTVARVLPGSPVVDAGTVLVSGAGVTEPFKRHMTDPVDLRQGVRLLRTPAAEGVRWPALASGAGLHLTSQTEEGEDLGDPWTG